MSSSEHQKALHPIKRFITTHDSEGRSTIMSSIPEQATPWQQLPTAAMFLAYTTEHSPVSLEDDTNRYARLLQTPPGLSYGSSVCRVVDLAPGDVSPMHRTQTIDYGFVIEGKVELILNDCTKVMERGDICVQRATMHAWRNMSSTEWARIAFVLIPCEKPVVGGKELGEDMESVDVGLKAVFVGA
jgi:quercetin dioxygenase-like cupin family protein